MSAFLGWSMFLGYLLFVIVGVVIIAADCYAAGRRKGRDEGYAEGYEAGKPNEDKSCGD